MFYVVLDLEATCSEEGTPLSEQEVIEVGAVALDESFSSTREFARFVRPAVAPQLTAFCSRLTSITQADVDAADPFPAVFRAFLDWIGEGSYRLLTWGDYDLKLLRLECRRHHLRMPKRFQSAHRNLKQLFADRFHIRPCGMAQALAMTHLPLAGTHHRGIDDARNIAKLARLVLP